MNMAARKGSLYSHPQLRDILLNTLIRIFVVNIRRHTLNIIYRKILLVFRIYTQHILHNMYMSHPHVYIYETFDPYTIHRVHKRLRVFIQKGQFTSPAGFVHNKDITYNI